jgi:hypothetical protein
MNDNLLAVTAKVDFDDRLLWKMLVVANNSHELKKMTWYDPTCCEAASFHWVHVQ